MTQHQPDPAPGAEPERGFLIAVLAQGVDEDDELAEMRELIATLDNHAIRGLLERHVPPDEISELRDRAASRTQPTPPPPAAMATLAAGAFWPASASPEASATPAPARRRTLSDSLPGTWLHAGLPQLSLGVAHTPHQLSAGAACPLFPPLPGVSRSKRHSRDGCTCSCWRGARLEGSR